MNMQTSFMHPPFGFALFYLRSVAPKTDYEDGSPEPRSPRSRRADLLGRGRRSSCIQIIMVGLIIAFPGWSTGVGKEATVDVDKAFSRCRPPRRDADGAPAPGSPASAPSAAPPAPGRPTTRR